MASKNNGSTYSKVTRQMVIDIKEDISEIKVSVGNLENHYSKRLPTWATIFIAFLSSVAVASIVYGFAR